MQETTSAMDVVEDTASTELPGVPLEIENLRPLIDKTLTELSNNVNIPNNTELLKRISTEITASSLGESDKERLLGTMSTEFSLQNLDHREFFLKELAREENSGNDELEVLRLRTLEAQLVRANNTEGATELTQKYLTRITDLEVKIKIETIRRYVLEGVGEVKLKSWLDLTRVETEVLKEPEARSRHGQLTRILSLVHSTAMAKGERAEWKKKIKARIQKAYEQWSEEWEIRIENLEQSTLLAEQLKDRVQVCRKELREDELLTKFDKDTLMAQLDQFISTRNMGELLETGTEVTEPKLSKMMKQADMEEGIQTDQLDSEGLKKRKLDGVIKEARQKKGKQEKGLFRANTVREECSAPTLAEQQVNVDNMAISAHQRTSNTVLIIDITEKWTDMDELIPFLERLIREQWVELRHEEGTTGWKQTVQESD